MKLKVLQERTTESNIEIHLVGVKIELSTQDLIRCWKVGGKKNIWNNTSSVWKLSVLRDG